MLVPRSLFAREFGRVYFLSTLKSMEHGGSKPEKHDASIPKEALRSANETSVSSQYQGKLNQIARPFRELISPYVKDTTRSSPETRQNKVSLTFKASETDLEKAGVKEETLETVRQILQSSMSTARQVRQEQLHAAMSLFARRINDTGSPEVQAALWSVKIVALEAHTRAYRHDYVAERKIVEWKDQRRKILRYLKRVSLERYYSCLDRLGLPHDLVEAATTRFPLKAHHGKHQMRQQQQQQKS